MLIITKRRKLGEVCGHTVYGVAKSRIVTIPHASVLSSVAYSKDEKRSSYVTSACKLKKKTVHLVPYLHLEIIKNFFHLYFRFYSLFFLLSTLIQQISVSILLYIFFFAFFTISRYSGHTSVLLYII